MNSQMYQLILKNGLLNQDVLAESWQYAPWGGKSLTEMRNMASMPGSASNSPMMMGEGQFGSIEMGGMFTVLMVRDGITSYEDPGWHDFSKGAVARYVEAAPRPVGGHQ